MGAWVSAADLRRLGIKVPRKPTQSKPVKFSASPFPSAVSIDCSLWLYVPTAVVSEANRDHQHWSVRSKRGKEQQANLSATLYAASLIPFIEYLGRTKGRIVVTWVHVGRKMDRHENLPRAFKKLTDGMASALGVDDGDEAKVEWKYEQRPPAKGEIPHVEVSLRTKSRL